MNTKGHWFKSKQKDDIDTYLHKFDNAQTITKIMEDNMLIAFLKSGLNQQIVKKIYNLSPIPHTYTAYVNKACELDLQYQEFCASQQKCKKGTKCDNNDTKRITNDQQTTQCLR